MVRGLDEIARCDLHLADDGTLFRTIFACIHRNWIDERRPDRWPSAMNWALRVAPVYTPHPTQRLEKQLQKQIAICLQNSGWGNDVPTASGLVNRFGRQMNVDLAHRIEGGFELIELKVASDTPRLAALQVLRYGALFLLYRSEPELFSRFPHSEILASDNIVLEVLAPLAYYAGDHPGLKRLECLLDRQVREQAQTLVRGMNVRFRFMSFPAEFHYVPGMAPDAIRSAVERRRSPFSAC